MMGHDDNLLQLFEDTEFDEDLFSIFDSLESSSLPVQQLNNNNNIVPPLTPLEDAHPINQHKTCRLVSEKSTTSSAYQDSENDEIEASPSKRSKVSTSENQDGGGQNRIMHITVERNRRKQMNEHLSVLRTLMPKFYVKRGDQASIIGGVVDYIKELQQVLQSLEAKKQRKVYSEVLSPRIQISSPRTSTLSSPRKPPLSPRVNLPISPRTPQPSSPYKPKFQPGYLSPTTLVSTSTSLEPSSSSSSFETVKQLIAGAKSKSSVADIEVKFSGPNVLLKTVSFPIPGQALKIIAALEALSLEILHVNIITVDDTMLNSFTIKVNTTINS
ncbi:Myc-type [Macleaya cordata]|uniref:Myc-type n=1 Tax=Macleaya cordata TaxID=56857 RepID=A0A200PRJ3_MACCD|nr:Myc-type [Macleaya cordata]